MVNLNVELFQQGLSTKGGSKTTITGLTPSSSLADVFLQACKDMGADSSLHILRHKKKEVDLSVPLRFANLPNNATLELYEMDRATAAKRLVSVSLQTDDGKRGTVETGCAVTLLDLLAKFEDRLGQRLCTGCAEKGETPCVSFMNRSFEGDQALAGVTLLQLGIVTGAALLKHSIKGGQQQPGVEAAAASAAPFEQASGGSAADGSGEEPAASAAAEVSVDAGVEGGAEAVRVETAAAPAEGVAAVKSDRQWIVGRSGDEAEASMMEVDDSFFEVTSADIKALMEASKKREDSRQMFKTKRVREQEREERLAKFTDCAVRIVFPDRTWLQARFSSGETLADVYSFAQSSLAEERRAFYLFTTPPPTKLQDAPTVVLKYTGLLPSAKVYFSWSEAPAGTGPFLAFKYLSKIEEHQLEMAQASAAAKTSPAEAGQPESGPPKAKNAEVKAQEPGAGGALEAAERRQAGNASRGMKQPKWFAMAKK